ncbi:hypothetical protein COHCIP112018_02383 [Cohnella sp. JJ-181]|nr:hypothetical protein COHCIP112018_02383 [Cohnella sp. JJ-181]
MLILGFALNFFAMAFKKFPKITDSWDMLGFIGALIGGGATLWAVVYTIAKQNKKDKLDTYPLKFLSGDQIIEKMDFSIRSAKIHVERIEEDIERHRRYPTSFKYWISSYETSLLESAKINAKAYSHVKGFNDALEFGFYDNLFYYVEDEELDVSITISNFKKWIEKLEKHKKEFSSIIENLKKEFERMV